VRAIVLGLIAVTWSGILPIGPAIAQSRAVEGQATGEALQPPRPVSAAPSPGPGRAGSEFGQPVENARVEASPLDTILLRDSKGNLVPVVGLPFEEFEQLLRAKKGLLAASPPAYTIETVSLAGKAGKRSADFQLTATIRVRENGWIRVPLHLPTAVIREPMQHEGPGDHFLAYDSATDGYVCWLNGNDARPHVIRIALSLPLSAAGDEQRLGISLPRATESSLRMVVDSPTVDASLSAGEGIASSHLLDNGKAEITVAGAAGDMQLAWRLRRQTTGNQLQLDASGEIAVRIHSEHRIAADARLRVRSYGPPLESFRVRLPPGMELISTTTGGGYSLTVVDPETRGGPPKNAVQSQQLVDVRLDKPAASAEILLRAQREADTAATGWFSPAQFSVIGAVRQRGTIDFSMDGEWQLDWKDDKSVHRIELMPDTAAARVVARYEYFRQPCGLAVKVSARPSRLSVEPIHRVYVEEDRIRIESSLKYRFRGARSDHLSFEMADWVFDRLAPDALLDFPLEDTTKNGELRIPFRPGAAPPTELELKLEAHRKLQPGTERLEIEFPRPRADMIVPATILFFASDNIELTPEYDEIQGLAAENAGSRPLEKEHPTFVLRDLGGDEPARFVTNVRTLKRVTTTATKATVRIDRQQVQIEQRIEYRVAHEAQREFTLLAPREIASSDSLDVRFNDQSSPAKQLLQPPMADNRVIRLQVTTGQPLLGDFLATIRYSIPLKRDRSIAESFTLPLVVPADEDDGSFSGQQVQFQLVDDVTVEPEQLDNEDATQPVPVRGAPNTYAWDAATVFSQWSLTPGRISAATGTHVSQMWVQTWLAANIRYERVALRVSTTQDRLRLRLPPGQPTSIRTAVDSEEVQHGKGRFERTASTSASEITIPLKNREQECVVEVWYSLDPPPRRFGLCQGELRTLQIPDAEPPRRAYWQLVTSPGEHLIAFPQDLSAEMAWTTDRFHMFRRPILGQQELESWIKASRQDLLPYTAHEYLFGAIARWPSLNVRIARSSVVVALTSAIVLLAGVTLLNIPLLRRPEILLLAGVVLSAGAVVWPDTAILVGQAGALGLAILALLAIWNYLATGRIKREIRSAPTSASKQTTAPSTHSSPSRREISSRLGTTHGGPLMEARP